jgi:hypothetical protein
VTTGTGSWKGGPTHLYPSTREFNDPTKAVYAAEMWSPGTEQWTTLSSNAIMRDYHGTALLMPDGRVLVAGGSEASGTPYQNNAEIFSPPYLFRAPGPLSAACPPRSCTGRGSGF